jgi:hypothetical protein
MQMPLMQVSLAILVVVQGPMYTPHCMPGARVLDAQGFVRGYYSLALTNSLKLQVESGHDLTVLDTSISAHIFSQVQGLWIP